MNQQNTVHQPVLLKEVLGYLSPKEGESYLDLTAGYGGHAVKVLAETRASEDAVLVDRDPEAIKELQKLFEGQGITLLNQDFLAATSELKQSGKQFDLILADLGVSSPHLDKASRGFTFSQSGPLDMRMDQRQTLTASEVINTWEADDLADIFRAYAEEPKARQIANIIVANRPFSSTDELAMVVAKASRRKRSKIHPATRIFQAIRIAVNSELELLEKSLPIWIDLLKSGGRIVIISFHSLEDRLVKQAFSESRGGKYDAVLQLLTKHPITASHDEIVYNPRARSAKLRAAVKIKKEGATDAYSGKK